MNKNKNKRKNNYSFKIKILQQGGDILTVGSNVKQTLVNLKSAQSTLRIYSIQTQDRKAKNAYREALKITEEVLQDLEKRLKAIQLQEPQYKGN